WAIEYGYKPLDGDTKSEKKELDKIAARSGERALQFSTDEDTTGGSPDPDSNRFDLGSDPLEYAKTRAQLVSELIPGLVDRMVKDGDDYTLARRALGVLLSQQGQAMMFAARQIGGLKTSRSHKGDKDAPPPFAVIDPKLQRDALSLLEQSILSDKPFQFPPDLLNRLAATNWSHWGMTSPARKDYSVHDVALQWQDMVLNQLLSSTTLRRLHDAELRVSADNDAMTAAELIERTTKAVFAEVDTIKDGQFTNRKPAISSLRRNLQRSHLRRLSNLAMGKTAAPDDCQTVAYADLAALNGRIEALLKSNAKLDTYSRAHLMESASRIQKVLDARITVATP
ncbi:MAG: zinc-dependent metalloprotease, partial [Planctomycetota bacterium]